ncbi:MAG: hypothetical protein HYR60_15150 [Acidobacteria bacterium]|nr:hypothetical protein [Acidobacteriota bacterium]
MKRWLVPSLSDVLFAAVFIWLIAYTLASGEVGLLQDSNTGAHVRTGDYILERRAIPRGDIFSFTKPGQAWFAWEWLSDVVFAALHRWLGLKGLVLAAAAVIAAANLVLLRHLVWRGANCLVAIFLLHFVVGASSVHYLARPHIFTLLFMAAALWLLDRDRERPSAALWALAPLTAVWVNLHGAFAGLLVSIAVVAIGCALERRWAAARRYALLALACLAASLANPYGFREHLHIVSYLQQKWILDLVQEFQSPKFHAGEARYFEILLVAGLLAAASLLARRQFAPALLALAWAHAALTSVRHVPIYALVVAPLLATEATRFWNRWMSGRPRRDVRALLHSLAVDYMPHLRRSSVWAVIVVLTAGCIGLPWPEDFPATRFPVAMASKHAALLSNARLYTLDSWADYLTYRFYPKQRVFVDGRSDFFGRELFDQYLQVLRGHHGWDHVLARHGIDAALVPSQSAVASLLRTQPQWRLAEDTGEAALFERIGR